MSGLAKVKGQIVDVSTLINTGLKGIHAFLGETERGFGQKLIGSWSEFKKHFGGLQSNNDFPLLCKRALEAGAKLRVGRVLNYTAGVVTGTKATILETAQDYFNAKSIGAWGNSIRVSAVKNSLGLYDLSVWIDVAGNVTELEEIENLKGDSASKFSQEDADTINKKSNLITVGDDIVGDTWASIIALATLVGTTGTDTSTILPVDYIGDSAAQTGIHVFDNANDFVRISIPAKAIPAIDVALVAYVVKRQDCRAILRTPIGISGAVAIDYREGTGSYSHSAINTWLASMIYGGLEITVDKTIPALADVAGNYAGKDNDQYEWFSAAGARRGKIYNALGIDYNLGSPALEAEADNVVVHGINPVIDDADYSLVYWGNRTLQKEDTLLKHENVADLMIFLLRAIKPLAKYELFEPNDIATWKAIWRKVNPLLKEVKRQRGVWDYLYQGDQHIDKIEDAVVNSSADVDAGKYQFIIWIKPKVGLTWIGFKVSVTNSGTSFEQVAGQPS